MIGGPESSRLASQHKRPPYPLQWCVPRLLRAPHRNTACGGEKEVRPISGFSYNKKSKKPRFKMLTSHTKIRTPGRGIRLLTCFGLPGSPGIRRFVDFQYYCCNLQIRARNSTNLALRGKWECRVLNTVAVQKGLHLAQEAQHSRIARCVSNAEDSGRHRTSLLYALGAMSPQNGVIAAKANLYPFDDRRSQGCRQSLTFCAAQ